MDIQIHGDLRTIKRDNSKKTIHRHTTIIQSKVKDTENCESHNSKVELHLIKKFLLRKGVNRKRTE